MSRPADQAYDELIRRLKDHGVLASCAGVLGWDERTYLPRKGSAHRAEQMALLARLAHEIGYRGVPYDALLDEYEPGATTADVARTFAELRRDLVPLIQAVAGSGRRAPRELLERDYPIDRQQTFGREAAAAIGFDFEA